MAVEIPEGNCQNCIAPTIPAGYGRVRRHAIPPAQMQAALKRLRDTGTIWWMIRRRHFSNKKE
jgi:hypothetical protein